MAVPQWSLPTPKWTSDDFNLLTSCTVGKVEKQSMDDIISNSEKFTLKFPVNTGQCKTLKQYTSKEILERNINSVYPVIHENALELYCKFILHKRSHGTSVERIFYKDMTLKEFIERLLKKRPAMFMGKNDKYILLDGTKGASNWESIGTEKERPPLVLSNCISYDEIKVSALLTVSSYTYFVNKGHRKNMAKYQSNRNEIAPEGVIVGVIGTRLKKPGVMEYQEIVANNNHTTEKNGYGAKCANSIHKLFSDFYEEPCLDYSQTVEALKTAPSKRYVQSASIIFDNYIYYKRLTITVDTLLLNANWRAKEAGKKAFVHVVGLGLGVWMISQHQEKLYMESFAQRIRELGAKLSHISDICFSWINQPKCGDTGNGEKFPIVDHPEGGIDILINKRDPHEKISEGKLLVVSYAWDGNALPGNEYWDGKLGSSGDSAAASSTQIAEIHNPHINPLVCADNLKVITGEGEVVTFERYQAIVRCRNKRKDGRSGDKENV